MRLRISRGRKLAEGTASAQGNEAAAPVSVAFLHGLNLSQRHVTDNAELRPLRDMPSRHQTVPCDSDKRQHVP